MTAFKFQTSNTRRWLGCTVQLPSVAKARRQMRSRLQLRGPRSSLMNKRLRMQSWLIWLTWTLMIASCLAFVSIGFFGWVFSLTSSLLWSPHMRVELFSGPRSLIQRRPLQRWWEKGSGKAGPWERRQDQEREQDHHQLSCQSDATAQAYGQTSDRFVRWNQSELRCPKWLLLWWTTQRMMWTHGLKKARRSWKTLAMARLLVWKTFPFRTRRKWVRPSKRPMKVWKLWLRARRVCAPKQSETKGPTSLLGLVLLAQVSFCEVSLGQSLVCRSKLEMKTWLHYELHGSFQCVQALFGLDRCQGKFKVDDS